MNGAMQLPPEVLQQLLQKMQMSSGMGAGGPDATGGGGNPAKGPTQPTMQPQGQPAPADYEFKNPPDPYKTGEDMPSRLDDPEFQQAMKQWMDENGREPATDQDFEEIEGMIAPDVGAQVPQSPENSHSMNANPQQMILDKILGGGGRTR